MPSLKSVESFFKPRSIAVAGVSTDPGKMGSIIFANLRENAAKGILKASLYSLNPAHSKIGDVTCYPNISSLPETPELLVIAVPVSQTIPLVKEAAKKGVTALVIIASGYAESGRKDLEDEIRRVATASGMRILGPNTIGVVDPWSGVDTLFLRPTKRLPSGEEVVSMLDPLKGEVAMVTQSGYLGQMVSEELAANGVGIRALVGTGNQLDVSIEDIIGYFADDEHTKVIAVYIEGIQDGRRFMRVAAQATKKKPVIVFKVGKTRVGVRAALTHTASLAGEYDHYGAAFRQSGLVEARDLQELVDLSISFSMLPRAAGRTLAIVTNAGGPGAMAADEAQRSGLEVKPLDKAAAARMRGEFRGSGFVSIASFNNPIDLTASASTEEFVKATELALGLDGYDMVLAIPTHQTPSIGYDVSTRLAEVVARSQKPVCMCVMGRSPLASMIQSDFLARNIPSFATPERAVRALAAAADYRGLSSRARAPASPRVSDTFGGLKKLDVRASYSLVEGLLRAYGITVPRSVVVRSRRDIRKAKRLGFPVACKMLAGGLEHKTEAGGVVLDVDSGAELASTLSRLRKTAAKYGARFDGMLVQAMVKDGVELIVGSTRDPTFGPVVVFGTGGIYTEIVRDFASAIANVTPREARDLISRTKLSDVLTGFRGGRVLDMARLTEVVSNFSRILVENPSVDEIEVNPLIATDHGIFAVDARIVLARR